MMVQDDSKRAAKASWQSEAKSRTPAKASKREGVSTENLSVRSTPERDGGKGVHYDSGYPRTLKSRGSVLYWTSQGHACQMRVSTLGSAVRSLFCYLIK